MIQSRDNTTNHAQSVRCDCVTSSAHASEQVPSSLQLQQFCCVIGRVSAGSVEAILALYALQTEQQSIFIRTKNFSILAVILGTAVEAIEVQNPQKKMKKSQQNREKKEDL